MDTHNTFDQKVNFKISNHINIMETIRYLYEKYSHELIQLKAEKKAKKKYFKKVAFDDIESELLYMYIRELKPTKMVEFAPDYGWSTFHILTALNKNQHGTCTSYDIVNHIAYSLKNSKIDVSRFEFVLGDVTEQFDRWNYDEIDFMFIDCDHSASFATKYCNKVIPRMMGKSKTVFIHDIFHDWKCGGQDVVKQFLKSNDIPIISPSKHFPALRAEIEKLRYAVYGADVQSMVHRADMNPVVILNPNLIKSVVTEQQDETPPEEAVEEPPSEQQKEDETPPEEAVEEPPSEPDESSCSEEDDESDEESHQEQENESSSEKAVEESCSEQEEL
jgi:predicted O-methyltransferase YrrM